jgi:alpha-D-ribose 1-methylphosphonate 5-triphosphate synthase subunit PhnG
MSTTRGTWLYQLTAHPASVLIETAQRLAREWSITHIELPQAGLGLLQLADGAFQQPYYLGEFPLARCHLRLSLPDGRCVPGAAQLMTDDVALVEALAVLDAVLAARLPGWEQVAKLVETGTRRRTEEQRERQALLTATRVDFALLGNTDDHDDDDDDTR